MNHGPGEVPHFVVSRHGADLKYFSVSEIYAASLGYWLSSTVPVTHLPATCEPIAAVRRMLQRKQNELKHILSVLSVAQFKLTSRAHSFKNSTGRLETMGSGVITRKACITKKLNPATPTKATLPFRDLVVIVEPNEGDAPFAKSDLDERSKVAERYVASATYYLKMQRKIEIDRLEKEGRQISNAMDELQGLRDEAETLGLRFDM
jgi:hypothetical protein